MLGLGPRNFPLVSDELRSVSLANLLLVQETKNNCIAQSTVGRVLMILEHNFELGNTELAPAQSQGSERDNILALSQLRWGVKHEHRKWQERMYVRSNPD